LGIGDWGLGIGDWGLGPIPNPQSPIPNPQSPFFYYKKLSYIKKQNSLIINYLFKKYIILNQ
jgi:hypothetical protein